MTILQILQTRTSNNMNCKRIESLIYIIVFSVIVYFSWKVALVLLVMSVLGEHQHKKEEMIQDARDRRHLKIKKLYGADAYRAARRVHY